MLLEVRNLSKSYGGIVALNDVSFSLEADTVTGLIGENGAGKSTLIKCIAGAEIPDSGEIILNGTKLVSGNPYAMRQNGIETVYQNFNLCPQLDAVQNIYLGREERIPFTPFLAKKNMHLKATGLLQQINASVPPDKPVGRLSGGQQQAVAIVRAMLFAPKLLILDEPTAALDNKSAENLLGMVNTLKQSGIAVLLISHRESDLVATAARVVTLEQGQVL
jgi:simple sugar transport system ATP-binding protein